MQAVENFKRSIFELKENFDTYIKSSFIERIFNKNKIDNSIINCKCKEFVSEELINELKIMNSPKEVTECFKAIDIFRNSLTSNTRLSIKKTLWETLKESNNFSEVEKKLFINLRKTILIEEENLKLEVEFKRVVMGGDFNSN